MVTLIKACHQYLAIYCFCALSVVGLVERDWNFGLGLNAALVLLYIFLYLQPIK